MTRLPVHYLQLGLTGCLALLILLCNAAQAATPPRIAIVLDDFGYNLTQDNRALALPYALTFAVIPQSPHAVAVAKKAQANGKQVLLHIPMATVDQRPLDKGGLNADVTQATLNHTLQTALARVPQAVGINNHMGSLLTTQPQPMTWLMTFLYQHNLFFIDSRTSSHSVAGRIARQQQVPTRGRDIFLDNQRDLAHINQQFNQLLTIARKHGSAIAIGHPYPVTIDYLQAVLPLLDQAEIELVPVSELLPAPLTPPPQP